MKVKDFNLQKITDHELFELFYDDLFKYFKKKKEDWSQFVRFDAIERCCEAGFDVNLTNDKNNLIPKRVLRVASRYLLGKLYYDCYYIIISPFNCEVFEETVGTYGRSSATFDDLNEILSKRLQQRMKEINDGDEYEQCCEFYLKDHTSQLGF